MRYVKESGRPASTPGLIGVRDNDEAVSAYLEEALETSDPAFVTQVLSTVACPCGMSQNTKETNLATLLWRA